MFKEKAKTSLKYYFFFLLPFIFMQTTFAKTSAEKDYITMLSLLDTNTETSIRQYSLYLKAGYQQMSGDYQKALKTYNDLFTIDAPTYVYDGYLRLLSETNQFPAIIKLIDKTQEMFKDNLAIQLIYAQSLLNTDNDEKAEKLLMELKEKHPDNEEIIYYSAAQQEKNNNLEKALNTINSFLEKSNLKSKYFLFYFLKSKIHLKLEQFNLALKAIEKSLQLFPQFDKGWLFKGLLLEQMGQIQEAINGYKQFLNLTGHNPTIEKQLVQLLFSLHRFKEAAAEFKKIKSENPEYFFDLALLEWKAENFNDALIHINKTLEKKPEFIKAKLLKIEILLSLNRHQETLTLMKNWITKSPKDHSAIHTLLLLQKTGIEVQLILEVLEQVNKIYKKQIGILLAMADLYLQTNQYRKALSCYQQVFNSTHNKELKAKMLFQIGFIHFSTNNTSETEKILNSALKETIVYPSTYNLLAYYYANQNKNLNKALEFVEKALKHNPNSPYYLDTKGYILLKQKNYLESVAIFEKAMKYSDNDSIIKEHLKNAQKLNIASP